MSLILAPCQERESAAVARRSLVMSPASSHQAHRVVLVFARARMCGHFSLVCSIKCDEVQQAALAATVAAKRCLFHEEIKN